MRKIFYFIAVVTVIVMVSGCGDYKNTRHGIVVGDVRLEVVNDDIIRVTASDKGFSKDKSLVTAYEYPETKTWKVSEDTEGLVVLSTPKLKACVEVATGKVTFTDPSGEVILAEKCRSFENGFRQLWESGEDEAYYGLGQHQSDEFNYKDKNEYLIQYNTKVTNPFVVSTGNYGILWDNYSLGRWGDARDYSQINEVFKIYDVAGAEGGLTGTYVAADGTEFTRAEPFLYFENLKANEELMPKIPFKGSNVTYDGFIEPSESGLFKFMLYYAGYMKVYVDGELVVPERWRTAWNPNTYKFACNLEKGKRTPFRIEWRPDGDVSYCSVRVLSPRPAEEEGTISFWSEAGKQIDYYFIAGENLDEVISGYRTVTGKARIMPKWAMGFWQCRERYKTQDELLGIVKQFRSEQIPLDNIIQDWFYWKEDSWGSHVFDADRYPDPKQMIQDVHDMNAHFMLSVWPKFYATTEHFKEFDDNGWMYRRAVEDSIRDWVGPGYVGSFYDAYSADARKLFWKQMNDHLFPLGVDAWWMDASEPNVKDCVPMDYWKALCGPTALGSSTEFLNAYGLMNAQAIYEGQRGEAPNQRVFLLTRSGFAGLQRYSTAIWSGDIASRWEDLKAQVSAGINFSMSGIPYWTHDIGGFCVEDRYVAAFDQFNATGVENADLKEWRELNARWYQFGAFSPLFRAHGQYPYREIFNIAPKWHPAYNSILYYDKLRYRMMPYIYSLAGMTWFDDYTIMRGLAMDFQQDRNVYNIGDQYMFGPSLMVCPVYVYEARERNVYFPENEGGWYDFQTGAHFNGGTAASVYAPYEKIPVFAPAGAIIPMGPDMQYASEKPADVIDLFIYSGQDGEFTLYEDEGTNYDYEEGKYQKIHIAYDDASKTVSFSAPEGTYEGAIVNRKFNIRLYTVYGQRWASVAYNGAETSVSL